MKVDPVSLERCVELLEASGSYRVLRRLPPIRVDEREANDEERVVVIVDTETTGLDPSQDEVIEIGGVAATYNADGRFTGVIGTFSQLREPSVPLSQDVVRLTGITSAMLKGRRLNEVALTQFVDQAALIVAHNASFDRPFCEALSDVFKRKPWACSATEVDWKGIGFDGAKLAYLVNHSGWFYEAHRALDDCNALLNVLGASIAGQSITPFMNLLSSARQVRIRLSFQAPFSMRSMLRARGFRWKPGSAKERGQWYADVTEQELSFTLDFLAKGGIHERSIHQSRITAFERYRLIN